LAQDIAAFFGDAPALCAVDGTWFIELSRALDIETVPPHAVQGRAVREHLPAGTDARRVHAWMNEMQMFLHAHPLNRERAARGLPALNGVWIWGEGQLPDIEHGEVTVHARSLPLRGAGELLGMARAHAALDEMLPA